MKSHEFQFQGKEAAAEILRPLLVVLAIAAWVRGSVAMGLLPSPRALSTLEETILTRQWERSQKPSEMVLVGDSSALMDVSGSQLSRELGVETLQLGTFSLLQPADFAVLASNSLHRSTQPGTVLLLVHPEFLPRPAGDPAMVSKFRCIREGTTALDPEADWGERAAHSLGLIHVRDRLESRWRAFPMKGPYGVRYGFSDQVFSALDRDGGLVDPNRYRPKPGSRVSMNVSPRLEVPFRAWRKALPESTRILVGITPVPESEAGPELGTRRDQALQTLVEWIGGNTQGLSSLPTRLPDTDFASSTHLTENAREPYTRQLAQAVRAVGSK